jgi:hypothetical protein
MPRHSNDRDESSTSNGEVTQEDAQRLQRPKRARKPQFHTLSERDRFLATLAQGHSVTDAAIKAGVNRVTVYRWRADDPDFAAGWDDAWEQRGDVLEQTAFNRAVTGWLEPVYTVKGELAGKVRKYSDSLLVTLLKGAKPERYRENLKVTGSMQTTLIPSEATAATLSVLLEAIEDNPAMIEAASRLLMAPTPALASGGGS